MGPSLAGRPDLLRDGLAVYRSGSGDPVLLMPGPHRLERVGLVGTDAVIDGLVAAGRQVVTYDPPGSGSSSRPAHLGTAEMHRCTDETLEALGVTGPVDAFGHSMGGLVLLSYALVRPARIRRLVLVGTGAGGPAYRRAPGALWNRSHPGFAGLAALGVLHTVVGSRATETLLRNYVSRRSFVDPRLAPVDPVVAADWWRRPRGRTDWHRVARRIDLVPRLGEITAPALVLCGRQDPQFPLACSEELVAHLPHARLVVLERSGHLPHLERPEEFWSAVRGFLDAPAERGVAR